MTDFGDHSPRRYFVDENGCRVLIGLTIEETFEFEIEPDFFSHCLTIDDVAKAVHHRVHAPAQETGGDTV